MATEGDALLTFIRSQVTGRVHATHVDAVTEVVAITITKIMADPRFFERLTKVQDLRAENHALREHLAIATAQLNRGGVVMMPRKKAAPRKAAAARKIPVKKAPAVRVKPAQKRTR
jgi:hypothetical protein